ncbi:MAG: hypothetical protein QOI99_1390 [Actinomycetota bacterium]|nr:hypothetical protein [Actinomycetota bacterium]
MTPDRLTTTSRFAAAAVGGLLLLAGCSQGKDATTTASPASTTATTAASATTAAAATTPSSPAPSSAAPSTTAAASAKVSANDASRAELQAAFEAAGIASAAQWAREVEEYRPYPTDDPDLAKLRGELAKYNPGPGVVDQIVAALTLP